MLQKIYPNPILNVFKLLISSLYLKKDWNKPYFEISSVLFSDFNEITYWKIELTVSTTTNDATTNGTSSLIIKINQTPINGQCMLSDSNGVAFQTYFTIS